MFLGVLWCLGGLSLYEGHGVNSSSGVYLCGGEGGRFGETSLNDWEKVCVYVLYLMTFLSHFPFSSFP